MIRDFKFHGRLELRPHCPDSFAAQGDQKGVTLAEWVSSGRGSRQKSYMQLPGDCLKGGMHSLPFSGFPWWPQWRQNALSWVLILDLEAQSCFWAQRRPRQRWAWEVVSTASSVGLGTRRFHSREKKGRNRERKAERQGRKGRRGGKGREGGREGRERTAYLPSASRTHTCKLLSYLGHFILCGFLSL